jgi:hypothetical protein
VLKRTFCGAQPIELKASVTPTPVPPEIVALSAEAAIVAVLSASMRILPFEASTVALLFVTVLSVTCASASLCTTLVAMSALMAVSLPPPNRPPAVLVCVALSSVAVSVASSSALTTIWPPVAVTVAPSM